MPNVPATPFYNYDVEVIPMNWPLPAARIAKLKDYLERRARKLIDNLARRKVAYNDQCEKARDLVQDILNRLQTDDGNLRQMNTALRIVGVFGQKPHFHEVEVEYRMS